MPNPIVKGVSSFIAALSKGWNTLITGYLPKKIQSKERFIYTLRFTPPRIRGARSESILNILKEKNFIIKEVLKENIGYIKGEDFEAIKTFDDPNTDHETIQLIKDYKEPETNRPLDGIIKYLIDLANVKKGKKNAP
ncbi:11573_t:CDS:2 [Funneliformis mosseae]|uniref:11573_t:CDS:1 n=1 Tax=Funneliformis mosseae TaxID=27381 RepID=A0A9N9EWN2_FUNMO|nr:11573_t:CDS:2 [Funneliformis mosseae]